MDVIHNSRIIEKKAFIDSLKKAIYSKDGLRVSEKLRHGLGDSIQNRYIGSRVGKIADFKVIGNDVYVLAILNELTKIKFKGKTVMHGHIFDFKKSFIKEIFYVDKITGIKVW